MLAKKYIRYKKFGAGGAALDPSAVTAGAGFVGQAFDALTPADAWGRRSGAAGAASGAMSGVAAGASLGPIGMAAGAVIGGVTGLINQRKANVLGNSMAAKQQWDYNRAQDSQTQARLAADPSLTKGSLTASYYAFGGDLPVGDSTAKAPAKVDWHQRDLDAMNGKIPNQAPTQARLDSLAKGFDRSAWVSHIDKVGYVPIKKANGGSLVPMSSDSVEVEGPSHEEGGVQIPEAAAEVEGGETIDKGYVFSKQLGFADLHKPIAKAIGKIESKPMSFERINSIKLLNHQEDNLKLSQEFVRKQFGLQ